MIAPFANKGLEMFTHQSKHDTEASLRPAELAEIPLYKRKGQMTHGQFAEDAFQRWSASGGKRFPRR